MDIPSFGHIKENAPKAAKLLRALSNPERLKILCRLIESEKCAGDLWQESELSQSAFSQHLAVLRKNGFVSIRKEAQSVYYSLSSQECLHVLIALKEIFCASSGKQI